MSFMEHLGELRTRIVRSLLALLVGLLVTFPFAEKIVDYLARPIKKMGYTLIFTSPTEAFWVQMKVALIAALFVASPGILWQVWRFVEPGLHPTERKYAVPFMLVGSLLFALIAAWVVRCTLVSVASIIARHWASVIAGSGWTGCTAALLTRTSSRP